MRNIICLLVAGLAAAGAAAAESTPTFTAFDLERSRGMLRLARDEVVKYFYDPARVGPEFQARCAAADQALATAHSNGEALMMIAQPFLDIGDSHTRFLPPARKDRVWHHWKFHAVGDAVYVSEVDRGSDAEKQDLRVGDRLLAIDGIAPTRGNEWTLRYLLYALAPRAGMRVVAQAPGQPPRQLDIMGEVRSGTALRDLRNTQDYYQLVQEGENDDARKNSRLVDQPGDILVWKLQQFDREKIAGGLRRVASAKAVILDLRGNPGGEVRATEDMLNGFFADDFAAFTLHERKQTETTHVRGKGYKGLLLVLIDHSSTSASEIFARTVQMRQRGILLGDRTGGALSTAQLHPLRLGTAERFTLFGVGITLSSVVMADGSIVEGKGVGPDYQILPTPEDLYSGRDPVLAQALTIAGHKVTSAEAGKLFPPID
jgi:C-terminal processing protease CtpA/Prc